MTALADSLRYEDTQLLDEKEIWFPRSFGDDVRIETVEPTGGLGYPDGGCRRFGESVAAWGNLGQQRSIVMFPRRSSYVTKLKTPEDTDSTCSLSAPSFVAAVGTAEMLESIREAVQSLAAESSAISESLAELMLDIPSALQEARKKAGLPVQDLAAMFGIKRRQFYNLTSGEDSPDATRERRIAYVTDAVNQISNHVSGNSRKARAALLARVDGDSVYDATVADDEARIAAALERALVAIGDSAGLRDRLAPSHRATSAEAKAVREFLSATRDDTGTSNDS